MGRRYAGNGSAAVGTDKTILNLFNNGTTLRPKLYDLLLGCAATPADQATKFVVQRTTAVGTEGSGLTPAPLDPGDPASTSDIGQGVFSVEPTYTSAKVLLLISLNQRATFRWVAAPGSELIIPATDANGLGVKSSAGTGTATHDCAILFEE